MQGQHNSAITPSDGSSRDIPVSLASQHCLQQQQPNPRDPIPTDRSDMIPICSTSPLTTVLATASPITRPIMWNRHNSSMEPSQAWVRQRHPSRALLCGPSQTTMDNHTPSAFANQAYLGGHCHLNTWLNLSQIHPMALGAPPIPIGSSSSGTGIATRRQSRCQTATLASCYHSQESNALQPSRQSYQVQNQPL